MSADLMSGVRRVMSSLCRGSRGTAAATIAIAAAAAAAAAEVLSDAGSN